MTEKKDSWTVWGTGFPTTGGDVEILSYQECMYTMNEGMTITEDWIQTFETFDAIVAVNDLSALGGGTGPEKQPISWMRAAGDRNRWDR